MNREVALSVVISDNYQYLHQAASRFMGGMQSNLIVFDINYLLWVMISTSKQLGHAFVLVTVVTLWPDINSTLYNNFNRLCPHVLNWKMYTIELHRHDSEFPVLKIP